LLWVEIVLHNPNAPFLEWREDNNPMWLDTSVTAGSKYPLTAWANYAAVLWNLRKQGD